MDQEASDWLDGARQFKSESPSFREGSVAYNQYVHCLEQAILLGSVEAMLDLAYFLRDQIESGESTNPERLEDRANNLERKAATLGNIDAMIGLGDALFLKGNYFLAQDWYFAAAAKGSAEACIKMSEWCTSFEWHSRADAWTALAMNGVKGEFPPKTTREEVVIYGESTNADLFAKSDSNPGQPLPRVVRDYREAEELARDWIKFFGYPDAEVTADGADGGIDVESEEIVAQVKFQALPVGRPVLQALLGVAPHVRKLPFFFSSSGYTAAAVSFAEEAGIPVFQFAMDGDLQPSNSVAMGYFGS